LANPGQAFATSGSDQPPGFRFRAPDGSTGATATVEIDGNMSAEIAAKDVLAAQDLAVHQHGAANAGAQRHHYDIRLTLCGACINHSGVGRVEVASVLRSWRNLRGDACRRPPVDPRHLREMPLTVLVDREGRIAISRAGVVDPLVFEAGPICSGCRDPHGHLWKYRVQEICGVVERDKR
jgi:hypothetical protein